MVCWNVHACPKIHHSSYFLKKIFLKVQWQCNNTLDTHIFVFKLTYYPFNLTMGMIAVGTPHSALLARLQKPLSVSPLKSLTVKQQSDNALIVEIKIGLLPSVKWVVNGEAVWGLERRELRWSFQVGYCLKCDFKVLICPHPPDTGWNFSQPIQINALLVEGNTTQTWCDNKASWEMFEQHCVKSWPDVAINGNLRSSSVYYH